MTWLAQRRFFCGPVPRVSGAGLGPPIATCPTPWTSGLQSLLAWASRQHRAQSLCRRCRCGLYQAGMRLFNGGAQAAGVLRQRVPAAPPLPQRSTTVAKACAVSRPGFSGHSSPLAFFGRPTASLIPSCGCSGLSTSRAGPMRCRGSVSSFVRFFASLSSSRPGAHLGHGLSGCDERGALALHRRPQPVRSCPGSDSLAVIALTLGNALLAAAYVGAAGGSSPALAGANLRSPWPWPVSLPFLHVPR